MDYKLFDISNSTRKNKMPYEVRYTYSNGTYYNITPEGTISDGYKNDFTFDTYEEAKEVVDASSDDGLTIIEVDELACCRCGIDIILNSREHDESIITDDGDLVCCDCKTDEDYE